MDVIITYRFADSTYTRRSTFPGDTERDLAVAKAAQRGPPVDRIVAVRVALSAPTRIGEIP